MNILIGKRINGVFGVRNKNKVLELVVTQYNDGEACIKRLLDSIEIQQCIDFSEIGVIIINDGDKYTLSDEFVSKFKNYSFDISYHIEEWSGLSGARQHGLDKVKAEYVMFCDGDDLFYRTTSLLDYLQTLKKEQPDILSGKFIADIKMNDGLTFKTINKDVTWVHGKCFKMSFLDEHKIKWNVDLKLYEDSYFVRLCLVYNPRRLNIENTTYFWKWRDSSTTRNDLNFEIKTYPDKIKSNMAMVEELTRRDLYNISCQYAWSMCIEMYFNLYDDKWKNDEKRYNDMKKYLKDYWNKYSERITSIKDDIFDKMIKSMQERFHLSDEEMDRRLELFNPTIEEILK